jgi:hypothetical protein
MLVFFGCNSNDQGMKAPDMSAKVHDLSVSGDSGNMIFCDPIKQDCPTGQKCTYISDPNSMGLVAACVPVTGTQGFEMPCDRDANGDPGMDNCAPGFFCSVIGWPGTTTNPQRHCNQLCATTSDCPANHNCIPRTDSNGDCVRNCGGLGSTSCGAGLACAEPEQDIGSTMMNPIVFLTCRTAGSGGPADACMEDAECQALFLCDNNEGTCALQLCDDSHMCPDNDAGISCSSFTGADPLGVCQ